MIKVSIVIPAYNVAPFLKRCLDSCCRQTEREIEIIVVDDGSKDDTPQVLDEAAREDVRICPIHKANAGVVVARQVGVEHALGEYVLFVDADDWLTPNAIAQMLKVAGPEVDMIVADHILVKDGVETLRRIGFNQEIFSGVDYVNACMRLHHGYIWAKLYRRELIASIRVDDRYTQNEDYLMNLLSGYQARKIVYVQVPVYMYYWDSLADRSKKYDWRRGYYSIVSVHHDVVRFLESHPDLEHVLSDGYLRYLLHNVATAINVRENYAGFDYFQSEMRRAARRSPARLWHAILRHKMLAPAYLLFPCSMTLARFVERLYQPLFRCFVIAYHAGRSVIWRCR